MNKIRRIVTGHTSAGKAIIVSDETVEGFSIATGKNFIPLWGTDKLPVHPDKGALETGLDWFPKPGGHRFFVWVVPPKSQQVIEQKSKREIEELLPGFQQHFEPENPGMHTSNSVDCTYLISGSITLELDDELKVEMNAGDSIVQNGTRHRWHNYGEIPAVFISTSIGSQRTT
ncbi:MAG: cupin domain-containing protein [Cyclobacteriaceae bacterium]